MDKKLPKFFVSSKKSSKQYNSPARTKKRNPIRKQQKTEYKQKSLTNEVEARLKKIKDCLIMYRKEK